MVLKFQFAFLGHNHNYVAAVTKVGDEGIPLDPSNIATYGLPESFCDRFCNHATKRYMFNMRGHDFLSHLGQWRTRSGSGLLNETANIYKEIFELHKFAQTVGAKFNKMANLITSFGPSPGSFFADSFDLKRYRWANLPADLEDEIQNHICCNRYGKIFDVAINAMGGWVMQLDRGKQFSWGGRLPDDLTQALSAGKRRKATINQFFLNHQHPTEYVLLFNDGQIFIRLHQDFEISLRRLVQIWAGSTEIQWHFIPSCHCSQEYQRQMNAAYYNQRGLFHISRGNQQLAYKYFEESIKQYQSESPVMAPNGELEDISPSTTESGWNEWSCSLVHPVIEVDSNLQELPAV